PALAGRADRRPPAPRPAPGVEAPAGPQRGRVGAGTAGGPAAHLRAAGRAAEAARRLAGEVPPALGRAVRSHGRGVERAHSEAGKNIKGEERWPPQISST